MKFKTTPVGELAKKLGGQLDGNAETPITGVAAILEAGPGDLTFVVNAQYARLLGQTRAGAVIVSTHLSVPPAPGTALVRVENPQLAFARAVEMLTESVAPLPGVYPGAHVAPTATIHPSATVMAGAYVGEGSTIGAGTVLFPQVVVMEDARIGAHCLLYPGVVVREECVLGDRVIVNPNVVIGGDGYGFTKDGAIHVKIPQVGNVVIGDDVELGAGCCIDRATMGSTIIRRGAKLDNMVHVAHGTDLGEDVLVAGQSGFAGSTKVGDRAIIAGRSGLVDHVELGPDTLVYSRTHVTKSFPAGAVVSGNPARPHREELRHQAQLAKMEKLLARVTKLEQQVIELEGKKG